MGELVGVAKMRLYCVLMDAVIDDWLMKYALQESKAFSLDAEPKDDEVVFRTSENGKVYAIDPEKGEIKGGLGPVKGKVDEPGSPGLSTSKTLNKQGKMASMEAEKPSQFTELRLPHFTSLFTYGRKREKN